jgi:peptidoglycan/xylan/chitin deacetylase (PgdA/CDA1 family)
MQAVETSIKDSTTISVAAPNPVIKNVNTGDTSKTVYLTFDDGPLNGTQDIIDVLNKEQLAATMFMVGHNMELSAAMKANFELASKDKLLEIANHSFSHANNHYKEYYDNPQAVVQDFDKNQQLLKFADKDGRMPGRNTWRVAGRKKDDAAANGSEAADLLQKAGYSIFGWDLEWQHQSNGTPIQTVQEMFQEIERTILDPKKCFTPYHFVLLSHDEMFQKPWEESELKQLVEMLKAKGYKFDHIDNYPRK